MNISEIALVNGYNSFTLLIVERVRTISSIFFLSLFGLVNFHNAFPHVHHKHDLDGHKELIGETHHHHHDSDHHHHSDEEENDHEEKTLLDFLFKNHSHSKHTHQYIPTTVEHVKTVKQIVVKIFGSGDSCEFTAKEIDIGWHSYVLFNDVGSDVPFLYSKPLRGPPSLG